MAERVTVPDMMNAREARAQAQRTLLARYPGAAVVCLCMNIAGPVKRTENIERAFAWGVAQVKAVLAPYETLFDAAIHEKTGPEAMICVRAEAKAVKKRLCALEDGEELGRLLDAYPPHLLRAVRHRIQADDRIPRAKAQPLQSGGGNALRVIGGVVGL